MNKINALIALFLVIAAADGAICDKRYYLQSGQLTTKTISLPGLATTTQHTTIGANMSGMAVLDSTIKYRLLASFQGSCAAQRNPIEYFTRKPGTYELQKTSEESLYVKIVSSRDTALANLQCDYWFKFITSPADVQNTAIMHRTDSLDHFHTWFGYSLLTDTTCDVNIGTCRASGGQTRYYPAWMPDSAALDNMMQSGWISDASYNGTTKKGVIRIQLLKAIYDTIQPASVITPRVTPTVKHTGKTITIRTGKQNIPVRISSNGRIPDRLSVCTLNGMVAGILIKNGNSYTLAGTKGFLIPGFYTLKSMDKTAGSFIVR